MKAPPFWHQRPLVCAALLFAAGIWAGSQGMVPAWLLAVAAAGCALCAFLCRRAAAAVYAGVLTAVFFTGACYVTALNCLPLPADGLYTITGYVSGDVEIREEDGFVHTYLKDCVGVDQNGSTVHLSKVYWSMTADEPDDLALCRYLEDGARVRLIGKLQRPLGRMNPYGFDFAAYLRQHGVRLRLNGMNELRVTPDARLGFSGVVYRVRSAISDHINAVFGEDAAYPLALLLGDKDQLPEETRQAFSLLGIAHVLTVSGLHVGLLSAFVMGIIDRFQVSPRVRLVFQGGLLLVYCALLDFAVPVVRASLLMVLGTYRRAVRRMGDPLTQLSAVFFLMLICAPHSLFSLSFQMTFGAVLGMVLFEPTVAGVLDKMPCWLKKLRLEAALTAAPGVLIPLCNAFHQVSLIGLLVSPLAVLLLSLFLPVMLVIALLGLVYLPLGQWLAGILHAVAGFLPGWMEKAADWPLLGAAVPAIPWPAVLAYGVIVFLCTRYCAMKQKHRLITGGAALVLAGFVCVLTAQPLPCYIQLYAGQADCAVVLDKGETIVIDTGTNGNDLADLLLSGGRRADTVILTHLHRDHAGGVEELLEAGVEIGRVLIPAMAERQLIDEEGQNALRLLRENGIPVQEIRAGDTLDLPNGRMDFVWPVQPRSGQGANQYSLCSLLELSGVRFLLTADVIGAYEMYAAQPADVLKVSHHGSADSTRPAFLEAVEPQAALITCAEGRNLPGQTTLDNLRDAGVQLYRTDETGAVTIAVRDGQMKIKCYLDQRK